MLVWVLAENPNRRFYESLGGRFLRSTTITLGGADLEEWAYGWDDLRGLAGMGENLTPHGDCQAGFP